MTFLFSDGNYPFALALTLMLIIAVLEGVLTVIGAGLSQILDNLLPDVDLDVDADMPNGGLSRFLAWLRVGQVPVLILLIIFLTVFGISGIVLQSLLLNSIGFMLPSLLAAIPAAALALPGTRACAGLLGKWVMKDETEAISSTDFIGQVVTITLGEARSGSPAEARFRDRFGTTHYLMVEPDNDEVFHQGEQMLLVTQSGATYRGIRPQNNNLK